jgi:hypothetical protein
MFENYTNIYNDSNKYANYGISQQEKKFLKKTKQQNLQNKNKYGLSGFSNSSGGSSGSSSSSSSSSSNNTGFGSNIEAFGSMNQTQFLQNPQNSQSSQNQTMETPQTLSGMNFGSPPPNPYPSNPSNTQNVTIQQINNQIQSLNNQNKLQAYNPKNPSNNLTTYTKQSEAVLSQNQLTDADIANLISLTSEYNQLIQEYNQAQTSIMSNADNQVLSMNSTTNPYLGQNLEISGGQVYYITNAGIAQPYEFSPIQVQNLPSWESGFINAYSQITNTPTTVNSTSAINATVYDSNGTSYINTTPAMQIGNPKYQWYSSGSEGTNVYANNSQALSFTDSSYVGCFNTSPSTQQTLLSLAPDSLNGNYTFQTCQQVAYDSGSQFFSFNTSNPNNQTGTCYLSNNEMPIVEQGPSVNYTYTQLWTTNITPVSGSDMSSNYMTIDPLGNIVVCNSSGAVIWSSDSSNNSLYPSNYIGCYQPSVIQDIAATQWQNVTVQNCWGWFCWNETKKEPVPVEQPEVVSLMTNNVTSSNSNINTWETCGDYAYNNGFPYYAVNNFNQNTGTATCLVGSDLQTITQGGTSNSCQSIGQIGYGNGGNALYSATNAPLNAFLTLQDNGMVTAFTGTTLQDQQTITWQLNYTGQVEMSSYQWMNNCMYYGNMQTGTVLSEGQYISSPNGYLALTMQGGNLVLYTSSNTPKCYGMTTPNNQTYYAGDISMNALYQMNNTGNPNYLGNIGYVDQNSILYQYPQNLVGQGNSFTYMGNYDSSGTAITDPSNGSIYWTGLDLSGAMQQCINLSCNAFVMLSTNNGNVVFKFMQSAFATPTYSQSASNYLPRFPNPNAQLYLLNPTVNNSPYCNKSITGINSSLYSNYQTTDSPMNSSMQCVNITTTDSTLNKLAKKINKKSAQLMSVQNNLMNKTMTVNQQEQLNEIILGRQFKEIDAIQSVQKKMKQNAVSAQNIKNDSNIVVLRENQSYTLWSVLAISIALISIHVIR